MTDVSLGTSHCVPIVCLRVHASQKAPLVQEVLGGRNLRPAHLTSRYCPRLRVSAACQGALLGDKGLRQAPEGLRLLKERRTALRLEPGVAPSPAARGSQELVAETACLGTPLGHPGAYVFLGFYF